MKIIRSFRTWIRRLQLRSKMLCIVAFTALIPTVFLCFTFFQQVITLQERESDNLRLSFEQTVFSMDRSLEATASTVHSLSVNPQVVQFFRSRQSTKETVMEYVSTVRPIINYISSASPAGLSKLRIYTNAGNLFYNLGILDITLAPEDEPFFEEIKGKLMSYGSMVRVETEGRSFYEFEYVEPGTVSIFYPIITTNRNYTFLEAELTLDDYISELSVATDGFRDANYALVHNSGEVLFSSSESFEDIRQQLGDDLFAEPISDLQVTSGSRTYLVYSDSVPAIDSRLVCYSDLNVLMREVDNFRTVGVAGVVFSIFVSALLAILLVNSLLRRARAINGAIHQMQEGNFDIDLPVYGTDFLEQVAANLNSTALRIKNLIENNYEKQLQIKDLQIRMLAQQISPHFLYNTLEVLKMRALLDDNVDMSRALTSLGRVLRYYADYSSDFVPLQRGLDSIRDYIHIISLVEERECRFTCHVDPELLNRQVPRFVLQPIVENSIKHASPPDGVKMQITVQVEQRGELICFSVHDNGRAVPPETVEEINRRLNQGDSLVNGPNSIGLYNTNSRLRLMYGDGHGLLFESREGEGTTVRFRIPNSPPEKPSDPGEEEAR